MAAPSPASMQEIHRPTAAAPTFAPGPPPAASTTASASTSITTGTHPPDSDAQLELLLVSGKRARVKVQEGEMVKGVLDRVWGDWPVDWRSTDPPPASANDLRLLYLGRFLKSDTTLSDAGLAHPVEGGGVPIVHLHVRTLKPPDKLAVASKPDAEESCCTCCVVC